MGKLPVPPVVAGAKVLKNQRMPTTKFGCGVSTYAGCSGGAVKRPPSIKSTSMNTEERETESVLQSNQSGFAIIQPICGCID
jgi:hypothetical protein